MSHLGPDKKLSEFVDMFIKELEDDMQAPAQSKFQDYIPRCRKDVQLMEEVREGVGWKLGRPEVKITGNTVPTEPVHGQESCTQDVWFSEGAI